MHAVGKKKAIIALPVGRTASPDGCADGLKFRLDTAASIDKSNSIAIENLFLSSKGFFNPTCFHCVIVSTENYAVPKNYFDKSKDLN